ncbi:hypothetical protein BDV95DRAFT_629693 [Massariosphaeria phaeospora]|uniref:Uncharacterized protein n=1 Tax=Massariosphaeria phaeospora TaxID=100035 RepID=A0A7C8MCF9_9PLEO|nr:hypothetical protein BDV95DRAFT_629693 [Massariosphaeria phaeospora]
MMHSSPEDDDNEMFPDEAGGPSTPRNTVAYVLDPASELSPPNSQGPSELPRDNSLDATLSGSPNTLNGNGKRVYPSTIPTSGGSGSGGLKTNEHQDSETGYQWSKAEDQPGFEWKSSRARDEETRALEQIVDMQSQIKTRYGDPLDSSIPARNR